jgi:hypothetical protein
MAKSVPTPAAETETKKPEQVLIEKILKANPTFGAKDISAHTEWKKAFPDKDVPGRTYGMARAALGMAPATKPGKTGGSSSNGHAGSPTVEEIRNSLELVRNEFGGSRDKCVACLEGLAKVGSIERVIESLNAYDDLLKLGK